MPDPVAPQLDELRRRARRRLVGAIVLALAAAVLVPMLLESDPKPLGEDVSVRIPPVDDGKFVNRLGEHAKPADASKAVTAKPEAAASGGSAGATEPSKDASAPAGSAAPAKSLSQAEQRVLAPSTRSTSKEAASANAKGGDVANAPAAAPQSPPPVAAKPGDASPSTAATASAPAKTPESGPGKSSTAEAPKAASPASAAKSASDSYSVQLAAFADDKGANALAGRLKKAGHPAYTEPYSSSRGTLWRVRVGPYPTRDAAEAARAKLKSEGQNGIIAAGR
jgi:DedD protein